MKKNGFTLIELLSVIIILAIISLIIVPNIISVLNKSKKSANEDSGKQYLKAVSNKLYELELKGSVIGAGTYYILKDGNLCLEGTTSDCTNILDLELSGIKPIGGTVVITVTKDGKNIDFGEVIYE